MLPVTRRTAIAGLAAAPAAAALATGSVRTALAASPPAGRQMPGAYRYKVGDFELTALTDGIWKMPLAATFVRNAEFDAVKGALKDAFLPTEHLPIPFTVLVVNTGSRLVLIDSGMGGFGPPTAGQLPENLTAAGIDPKAIDTVVISHFHGDHINGLRDKAGALLFPNAEIMVPEPEWAFWMDEGQMSRAPEGLQGNFKNVRRVFGPNAKEVRRFAAEGEVLPGVVAIAAPGHTPGHTAFRVASGDAQMLVLSDTTNHPALFVTRPEWQASFDMDGAKAAETRKRLLDTAVADRMLVQGYHFPFPASGHIVKDGQGYRLVPVAWSPVI